jgi:hypothetical protein
LLSSIVRSSLAVWLIVGSHQTVVDQQVDARPIGGVYIDTTVLQLPVMRVEQPAGDIGRERALRVVPADARRALNGVVRVKVGSARIWIESQSLRVAMLIGRPSRE